MNFILLINSISVGIFGTVMAAAFCDIVWTWRKRLFMAAVMAGIMLLQGIIYFRADLDTVRHLYPAITHIPLAAALCALSNKRLWPLISVLTAYLCCQLRRWLALILVTVSSGAPEMQNMFELIITLPLLLLLLRLVAPSVREISHYTAAEKYQFGFIPALSYGFDYLTRIYTDLLSRGNLATVEFMPFLCSVTYLIFVLRTSAEGQRRRLLEREHDSLNLQVTQAVREISLLRESERRASTYRHDLRHHMQYLLSCIENGRIEQARTYILETCSEIESNRVIIFCENEAANLIFSTFSGRALESGIAFKVRAAIPQILPVSESDLCVLLSNALENALHACQKLKDKGSPGTIETSAYEKNGKLFLQITNSCDMDITFSDGIPVTNDQGHGIGVRSICAIVNRYSGIYTFSARDNRFILRVSL